MNNDSYVEITPFGTIYGGPDAVLLFQAISLRSVMRQYARTGIVPTRGFGKAKMVMLANRIIGQDYATRQFDEALSHLHQWVEAAKAAMPVKTR